MALHVRYTAAEKNDRVVVKFVREDLLWRGALMGLDVPLEHPGPRATVIGPTILDMLVRREAQAPERPDDDDGDDSVPAGVLWSIREPAEFMERNPARRADSHPFKAGLVSGGTPATPRPDDQDFVRVTKLSSVSIGAYSFRLAVAAVGGIDAAQKLIAAKAANAWEADLQRSLTLYALVRAAPDEQLLETLDVEALRPAGSISDEIETSLLREACQLLGVDPDLDIRRPRGRPKRAQPTETEEGDFIAVQLVDGQVVARTIAAINGIPAQTDLSGLTLLKLIALLDVLVHGDAQADVDLLEAFLDASAPDWRTNPAAEGQRGASADDPYSILGVAPDQSMEHITQTYRRAMQAMHPDKGACPPWFAQVAAAAYRRIKEERGNRE